MTELQIRPAAFAGLLCIFLAALAALLATLLAYSAETPRGKRSARITYPRRHSGKAPKGRAHLYGL